MGMAVLPGMCPEYCLFCSIPCRLFSPWAPPALPPWRRCSSAVWRSPLQWPP